MSPQLEGKKYHSKQISSKPDKSYYLQFSLYVILPSLKKGYSRMFSILKALKTYDRKMD